MDANQLLDDVAGLLELYRPAGPGTYVLYAENGKIRFGLHSLFWKCGYIIATLTSRDVNEGPGVHKWHRIEDKIRIFMKQGVL